MAVTVIRQVVIQEVQAHQAHRDRLVQVEVATITVHNTKVHIMAQALHICIHTHTVNKRVHIV